MKEYPDSWDKSKIPYYPINDEKNNNIYSLYKNLIKDEQRIIFGGRLAQYKYFDMHQIVGSALKYIPKITQAINNV
jgi:UDP-galactopyranose mutase